MSVFAHNNPQPLVGFTHSGGGMQIASGVLVLDFRDFKSLASSTDWLRDDILWDVNVDTLKWKNKVTASLIVFPLSFDIGIDTQNTKTLGWAIDSFGLDPSSGGEAQLGPTDKIGLVARLALKTSGAEMLRVGYQLTLSA